MHEEGVSPKQICRRCPSHPLLQFPFYFSSEKAGGGGGGVRLLGKMEKPQYYIKLVYIVEAGAMGLVTIKKGGSEK